MDERTKCDLPYGHFGRGDYLLDEGHWNFRRVPVHSVRIERLGEPTVVEQYAGSQRNVQKGLEERPSTRRSKQIQALIQAYPEVQPTANLLSPLLKISEAVTEAGYHEATKSSLLAFSSIRSGASHRSVSLAAFASGLTGCELRIVRVRNEKRSWNHGNKNVSLEIPSIQGEDSTLALQNGPIQQVCFAQPVDGRNHFLAARLLTESCILLPKVNKAMKEESSSISCKLLYRLPARETGGKPHADIVFNPWFPQQFGVVDQAGNWRLLEFDSPRMERVTRKWTTPTPSDVDVLCDGWARITWIWDHQTVLVCTRRQLSLFSMAGEQPVIANEVDLSMFGAMPWIFDFKKVPGRTDSFCIMNATHLVVYQVTVQSSPDPSVKLPPEASIKLSMRHLRNSEDLSVRIEMWTDSEELNILLYSATNCLTSILRLDLTSLDRVIAEDPINLDIYAGSSKRSALAYVHVSPVSLTVKTASAENPDESPLDGCRFYNVISFDCNHSIHESLFCRYTGNAKAHRTLTPSSLFKKRIVTSSRLQPEGFVLEDEPLTGDLPNVVRHEPVSRRMRKSRVDRETSVATTNLELMTNRLKASLSDSLAIEEVAARLREALVGKPATGFVPMQTLRSLTKGEITVADVGEASESLLQGITSTLEALEVDDEAGTRLYYTLTGIALPGATGLSELLLGSSLSSLNDRLVALWISSLSSLVPGWVRLAKVDIVRRVAVELMLASQAVGIQEKQQELENIQQTQSDSGLPNSSWELPVRISGTDVQTITSSPPPAVGPSDPHSGLPTPSPTATPSVITASSHASSFAAPELYRLSKYTTFAKPAPMVLPRALKNVLSHWEVGMDPSDYDWMSASRHISNKDDEVDEEEMTAKERKRLERRVERHKRRERKEAAASQAQQFASSQAAAILSASQPSAMKGESQPVAGSSQSQSQSAFAASQVVPGRFGGRPPPKKKRKQGF